MLDSWVSTFIISDKDKQYNTEHDYTIILHAYIVYSL